MHSRAATTQASRAAEPVHGSAVPPQRTPGPERASNSASGLLSLIADVERLRNQLDGMQSVLEVAFRREQMRAQQNAGVAREHLGRGIAEEIALVRGTSPKRAGDQLALRRVLVESMPLVFARVMDGALKPWAAEQAAQAALVLEDEDRARFDAELAAKAEALNPGSVKGVARRIADRLDQDAAIRRLQRAESQRHVSIRPVADGMVRLSALLPTRAGVAAYAALTRLAATATATAIATANAYDPTAEERTAAGSPGARSTAAGSPATRAMRSSGAHARSKGQRVADALVERIIGAADPSLVPVEIQLLMTDRTLLAGGSAPALLDGHPIPASAARALALNSPPGASDEGDGPVPARFIRRLFTDPVSGRLIAMDGRRRAFTGAIRAFIRARDQRCRIPFCEAPIRDIDHVHRYADGGATTISNGVGLCQRHNLSKEMPGWKSRLDPRSGALRVMSPGGHTVLSAVPDLRELTGPPLDEHVDSMSRPPVSPVAPREREPSAGAAVARPHRPPPGPEPGPDDDGGICEDDVVMPGDLLSEDELAETLRECSRAWGLIA